jgi:prevent-host-death family protein
MYGRYMMSTKSAMKEARDNFSDLVNRSSYGKERIVLTRRGKGSRIISTTKRRRWRSKRKVRPSPGAR